MEIKKNKSIAVMTWQLINYGTALQAFALNQYLRDLGYHCDLVNYSLENENLLHVNSEEKVNFFLRLKGMLDRKQRHILEKKRMNAEKIYADQINAARKRIEDFYKEIPHIGESRLTKEELPNLLKKYTCFICGSDQIWNPKFLDNAYYLDFVENAKRLAYAPSMGVTSLTNAEKNYIIPRIKKFDAVSVRETQSADLLKENGIKDVRVVADPTLLLSRESWDCKIPYSKIVDTDKKVVFVYFLGQNNWYKEKIQKLKEKMKDWVWITIPKTYDTYMGKEFDIRMADAGPVEFINLIRQSQFVLTDSYHGVCMALKYHKNFLALKRFLDDEKHSENSRIQSLLELIKLPDRLIDRSDNHMQNLPSIDWNMADVQLEKLVKESRDFLEVSLR